MVASLFEQGGFLEVSSPYPVLMISVLLLCAPNKSNVKILKIDEIK